MREVAGWRDKTEKTYRKGGLSCHFVSMCPLKGMSQWKEKQNCRVTASLSIKCLFLLFSLTLFHIDYFE